MPRPLRIEFPGARYHVVNRGNRGGVIFEDDEDRRAFLRFFGEAAEKTGWRARAFCLLPDQFHLVLETPRGDLVAGMKWLLGVYTWRFNRRHDTRGHLFGGRYRAVLLEDGAPLRTACDYVHLGPAWAGALAPDRPLRAYPWSSLPALLGAAERPGWLRTGEETNAAEREAALERLRHAAPLPEWRRLQRGWCFGSPEFKARVGRQLAGATGVRRYGRLPVEAHEARAEAIIAEELAALGWTEADLAARRKMAPEKARIAARLQRETVMTVAWMARRLQMGSLHTARNLLARHRRSGKPPSSTPGNPVVPPPPAATPVSAPAPPSEPVVEEPFDVTWD